MTHEHLREGLPVFLHDGEVSVGAVREVHPGEILVYIENTGDVRLSMLAVQEVHFDKVVLNPEHLSEKVKAAIARAHSAED
ncbi:MAG: hypothetical protein R3C52_08480 [Hyphomonadaceae bacterium]